MSATPGKASRSKPPTALGDSVKVPSSCDYSSSPAFGIGDFIRDASVDGGFSATQWLRSDDAAAAWAAAAAAAAAAGGKCEKGEHPPPPAAALVHRPYLNGKSVSDCKATSYAMQAAERKKLEVQEHGGACIVRLSGRIVDFRLMSANKPEHPIMGHPKRDSAAIVKTTATNSTPPAAKRGRVGGFSKSSRRRMLRRAGMSATGILPIFVTLTIGQGVEVSPAYLKACHRRWWRKLVDRWPKASCLWRLELGERFKRPHLHFLLWGVQVGDAKWMAAAWQESGGGSQPDGSPARCDFQVAKSSRGVASYAAKYAAKCCRDDIGGRHWGVMGREYFPWGEVTHAVVHWRHLPRLLLLAKLYLPLASGWSFSSTGLAVDESPPDTVDDYLGPGWPD